MSLNRGDIGFVLYNTDEPSSFAFVTLVNLEAGESIRFTDRGWLADHSGFSNPTGDSTVEWVAPSEGVLAGTVITIAGSTATLGSVNPSLFSLSGGGDQILAYQGDDASPSFIAAINNDDLAVGVHYWNSTVISPNTSALPAGLTHAVNSVSIAEIDNAAYTGPTEGDRTTLLQALNNRNNWNTAVSDTIPQVFSGTFTVTGIPDTTPPAITALSPADDAADTATGNALVMTFDEPVQTGSGFIRVKTGSTTVEAIAVSSHQVSLSNDTVTIDLTDPLAQGQSYFVEVDAGAVADLWGNPSAGISNSTTWNFTTEANPDADTTAPSVSTYGPLDDATDVAVGANLTLTFDEAVAKGSGNIVIKKSSDDSVVATIDVTTSPVTVSGSTVTIDPSSDLAPGIDYYVEIAAGAFEDTSTNQNQYAGITGTTTWNFTTALATGATSILINEIDTDTPGTDAAEFIELYGAPNTSLNGLVIVLFNGNDDRSYAAFDLDDHSTDANGFFVLGNTEATERDYAIGTVQNGTDAIALYQGNAADFPNDTAVTTDNIIDAVVYGIDNDHSLKVLLNPGQSVIDENGNGDDPNHSLQRISNGSGGGRNTSTFVATMPTPGATNVEADLSAPGIQSTSPSNNGTNVAVDANLTLTFDEAVQKGTTGNVVIKKVSDNSVVETVAIADTTVSGSTLTINPTANLDPGTNYYVEMDAGAIEDTSPSTNDFGGITGSGTWAFTTQSAGVTVTHSNGNTTVTEGGSTDFYQIALDTIPTSAVTIALTVSDGQTEISTDGGTTYNTTGSINLTDTSAKTIYVRAVDDPDEEANPHSGSISHAITSGDSFYTSALTLGNLSVSVVENDIPDTDAPIAETFSPTDDAINVALADNLSITFDETVQLQTGNISLYTADGTLIEAMDVTNSSGVSLNTTANSNDTVVINPTADLEWGQRYYLTVDDGAIADLSDNGFSGISDSSTWSFATRFPTLSIDTVDIPEGNTADRNATFTVTLSDAVNTTVTVNYTTVDGSATSGAGNATDDYTAVSGTLSFSPNTTRQTIEVPILGDTIAEPDESFTVVLSAPSRAILVNLEGTGTLRNDDVSPEKPEEISPEDTTAPIGAIAPVTPDLRETPVSILQLTFSEAVNHFDISDIQLTRNGTNVSLSTAQLIAVDDLTWSIEGLAGLTAEDGTYEVTLKPSNITDKAGNPLAETVSQVWQKGTLAPPLTILSNSNVKQEKTRGLRQQGTNQKDILRGTPNNDVLRGGRGNDILIAGRKDGSFGHDKLYGQSGNDILRGGHGTDFLSGGTGKDRLKGGKGNDELLGNTGNDTLVGGNGRDILIGDQGNDRIRSGKGRDLIVFNAISDGIDRVLDFSVEEDVMSLGAVLRTPAYAAHNPFAQFVTYVDLVQVGNDTEVRVDVDGSGSSTSFITLASLKDIQATTLTAQNFTLT